MAMMWARVVLGCVAVAALAAPPKAPPVLPPLLPGETLVLAGPDREIYRYGDNTSAEGPMGGLAHLVWVKLEGNAWASEDLQFKCTGTVGPFHCSEPKGHGKVDLVKAMQASCNLAFLGWAHRSADRWQLDYGEGAARARLVDAFGPFLGKRVPEGEELPPLGLEWFGEGDLLRTSPDAFLNWLLDPAQEESVRLFRRLVLNFIDETFKKNAWWIDAEVAPVSGVPGASQAWAVGGNELVIAVLRLPPGSTRAQAFARFTTIMTGPKKKK